jgi:hypothetical protein
MRVRSRAGADDALIRGMCVSAARSLCKAIHRWNTHIYSVCIPNACMYLYPCASSYTDERIADAGPPHTRAHVLRPSARVRVRVHSGAHASALTHASAFRRRRPRVARLGRRSTRRRRSTRTSARGTPRRSPRWTRYAPSFRPGRLATVGGTRSAGSLVRREPLCAAATADARSCVCAQT